MELANHWLETFGIFILHYLQLKLITDINISKNIYDFVGLATIILYLLSFLLFILSIAIDFAIKIKEPNLIKNHHPTLSHLSFFTLLICLLLMLMPTIFINIETIRYFRKISRYSKRWKKYQKAYKFWKNSHIHTIHDLHTPFDSCLEFALLTFKLPLLSKTMKINHIFKWNKNKSADLYHHEFIQIRTRFNLDKVFFS